MPAIAGRKVRIKRGSTAVAGARADSFTINNEPIDITEKDNNGWRKYLSDVGVRSIDAEVEGIVEDTTFLALAVGAGSALLEAYTIELLGLGSFTGNFFLASFAVTGEQADATTFTASIQSSGTITFTAS